jgi:hypothetical protein
MAATQVENQLGSLLTQNFIVREGRNLKARAVFNQGKLVLNGRMLPLF